MGGGRGAPKQRFSSSRFSSALHPHSASNMGVPLEMDSLQPDRYAAVVYHFLESISVLESSFTVIFVAEERASSCM